LYDGEILVRLCSVRQTFPNQELSRFKNYMSVNRRLFLWKQVLVSEQDVKAVD